MKRTATIQVLGYPVLLLLIWLWLGIGERSVLQLLASVLLGAVIVAFAAFLLSTLLADSYRRGVACAVGLTLLVGIAWWLTTYSAEIGNWLAARVSQWRKLPANPRPLARGYSIALWCIVALLIAATVPYGAARPGLIRSWRYWLAALGFVVIAVFIPWRLIWWVPAFKTMTAQTASMTLRFLIAYLLLISGLLAAALLLRRQAGSKPAEHGGLPVAGD